MKWEELSLKNRADLMKLYIQNGFTNLSEIKKHYNSFDNGGSIVIPMMSSFINKESLPFNDTNIALNQESLITGTETADLPKSSQPSVEFINPILEKTGIPLEERQNYILATKEDQDQYREREEELKDLKDTKFRIPDDNPEAKFIAKVNRKNSSYDVKKLSSLPKEEIAKIQKTLADNGYYDKNLTTGRSEEASEVQKILYKNGYLTSKDIDGIIGVKTTTALQKYLVDNGYLDEATTSGNSNIDGIIGKETRAAYNRFIRDKEVDGLLGNKTKTAYKKYLEETSNSFNKKVSAEGMADQCAAWVSKKYDSVIGGSKQDGVYGNAWNMIKNIENAGGNIIFNAYDLPEFDNVKSALDVKTAVGNTKDAIKPLYKSLLPGDVVGIHNPSSTHYKDVLNSGTTYNTHVGIVVDIDKDGMPIVEHNILGKVRRERADRITGSVFGSPIITAAVRPAQRKATVNKALEFNSSIKSSYKLEKESFNNPLMRDYMDSLAQSKEAFKDIFPDVDSDFIEKASIAILKRETNFMTNKPSDNKYNPMFIVRRLKHKLDRTPEEVISQDLTKTKFNSLSQPYRDAIGLYTPEQLSNDPIVTGRAVYLIMAKNYDYFKRLAQQNPKLKLTKEDIENATIAAYNVGLRNMATLGFNPDGTEDHNELEAFRSKNTRGIKIKDIGSTNYKYLGKIGEALYDKFGKEFTPYVVAARDAFKYIEPANEELLAHTFDKGGTMRGAHGEVPFTTDYSKVPDSSRKTITLDNLHELAKDNPALYRSYMQRLPKEYQAKVIENAARSRYGYEGLNQAMTAAATGGLPGLLGYTGAELVNKGVSTVTDSNSWGDLLYKGNNPIIRTLAEISNPGNILGGIGSTRSITSRYKPNVGNNYSVTPEAIKSLLTPSKYETINAVIPESHITGFTPKVQIPDGFPYSFYETAYSTPRVRLLEAPTIAQRRAFEVLQGTYKDPLPDKYLNYKAPEEILITPRITSRLPYMKDGKYSKGFSKGMKFGGFL